MGMTLRLRQESEMLFPIEQWLLNRNYVTKVEIQLPWGICDLVGMKPELDRAVTRLNETGKRTIGNFTNAWLMVHLPSPRARKAVSREDLLTQSAMVMNATQLSAGLDDLVARQLATKTSNGKFQRACSWFPYHDSVVAVELKLSRIEDVLSQATRHKALTKQSYIALPIDLAERLMNSKRRETLEQSGVGLIATDGSKCMEMLMPKTARFEPDPVFAVLVADRFWGDVLKTIHH